MTRLILRSQESTAIRNNTETDDQHDIVSRSDGHTAGMT
ncbi:MAG: hypothetical protein J07HX5_00338 [halophilic archaeon J07HX5]|nr:MAG: hypothetical protein J07HX5_00338 [halophilic archaeon J07HX5]